MIDPEVIERGITIREMHETQKLQTNTIKELLSICAELVDRVKTLEGKK